MRQGKTAPYALSGMLSEIGTGCCFVSKGNGERHIKRPNDTARHSLNRMSVFHKPSLAFAPQMPPPPRGRLIPHPHLAGTQTALPSVPAPARVSLVVVPLLTNDIVPSPAFASQMPPPPRGEANLASPSCRHSDGFAVGARTRESELGGCATPYK